MRPSTKIVIAASLTAVALFASACGGGDQKLKEIPTPTTSTRQEPTTETTADPGSSSGVTTTTVGALNDYSGVGTIIPTRPEGLSSQEWWKLGEIMRWFFDMEPGKIPFVPESNVVGWSAPENSDVGSPEFALSLTEAGKNVATEWLTGPRSDGPRGALAPAEGVTIFGAAAAKAFRSDGGPQLYRVAVLWSAAKDRDFGRPVANQMVEMYFSGSPGDWTRVPCEEAGPSMCVPIFQTII